MAPKPLEAPVTRTVCDIGVIPSLVLVKAFRVETISPCGLPDLDMLAMSEMLVVVQMTPPFA
jgi:hypothetical protein